MVALQLWVGAHLLQAREVGRTALEGRTTPAGYAQWERKALKLWKKAGSMADTVKDA